MLVATGAALVLVLVVIVVISVASTGSHSSKKPGRTSAKGLSLILDYSMLLVFQ